MIARAVAVVGSRDYPDLEGVRAFVRSLPAGTTLVSGGARGVDSAAAEAARERGIPVVVYAADWARLGRAAGPVRNRSIAEHCDRLVAFWDGESPGTADVVAQARALGREVEVRPVAPPLVPAPAVTTSTRDRLPDTRTLGEVSAERWRDFEPPPIAKADELDAAIQRIKAMAPAQIRELSIRAGVHDEDGNLTAHYRPPTDAGGRRR